MRGDVPGGQAGRTDRPGWSYRLGKVARPRIRAGRTQGRGRPDWASVGADRGAGPGGRARTGFYQQSGPPSMFLIRACLVRGATPLLEPCGSRPAGQGVPDRGAGPGPDLLKTLVPPAGLILEHVLNWVLLFVLGAECLMLLVC